MSRTRLLSPSIQASATREGAGLRRALSRPGLGIQRLGVGAQGGENVSASLRSAIVLLRQARPYLLRDPSLGVLAALDTTAVPTANGWNAMATAFDQINTLDQGRTRSETAAVSGAEAVALVDAAIAKFEAELKRARSA